MSNADKIISALELKPHPEGGYYKEVYRAGMTTEISQPERKVERQLATSIYFLLKRNDISKFHQLTSDELWYFHYGAPVKVIIIDKHGVLKHQILGCNIEKGEKPQIIIPAGCIFAAKTIDDGEFALMGCMVTPGFDFDDFRMLKKEVLLKCFPKYREIIEEYAC